jgi:hypothetical protein
MLNLIIFFALTLAITRAANAPALRFSRKRRRYLQRRAETEFCPGLPVKIPQARTSWSEESLELLGQAQCLSFGCGIESVTEGGRDEMNKICRLTTTGSRNCLSCAC